MTSALYDNIYFRKDSMMHHTSFLRQKRILQSAIEELEKSPGESFTNFTIHSDVGSSLFFHPSIALHFTEGSPFTIRNHPVKTQTFDLLYIFVCNTSQIQFPCNIRLSLAYNHDKQILSGFL